MDDDACLDLIGRAAAVVARWQAIGIHAQARFAALRPPDPPDDSPYSEFAADETAPVLHVSPITACNRLWTAHTLTTRLPATLRALETGRIDQGRALAMADLTEPLDHEKAAAVETAVLARGGRPNHAAFRAAVRRAVLKAVPDAADARRKRAEADREVTLQPLDDGMADLRLNLPAAIAEAAHDRLTILARRAAAPDDPRSLNQRRADVAAALLLGAETGADGAVTAEVHVTVPLTTLLCLARDPGELEGYGPIPPAMARELAENATWRRIVTDPVDGTVLDVGDRRYPSAALARHVRERDQTCRFPGCLRPARKADIDHTKRHVDHGPTADRNLEVLCRHHHRLKDDGGTRWKLSQPVPGHFEWVSPTGRTYAVGPTPVDPEPPAAPPPEEELPPPF
jgi:hypothetical protein